MTTAAAAAAAAKMTMVTEADDDNVGNLVGAPVVVARKVPWKDGGDDCSDWPWCD